MNSKQSKDTLRSNPPNIPDTHWESIVHNAVLDENVESDIITLTSPRSAGMIVDTISGEVTITLQLNTSIETVNNVLNAFDIPVDGWEIKA